MDKKMINAENEQIKSNRDKHIERLRTKYPDKKFEDDEEIFGQIYDDYDDYDKQISERDQQSEAFVKMFERDPRSARMMMEWRDGNDPIVTLIRMYGKDAILEAIEDEDRLEEIENANKEWADRAIQNDAYDKEYNKNLPESLTNLEQWAQQTGKTDEQVDAVMEQLAQISKDYIMGKFTTETLEMISKAINYDSDIETAQIEGEVAGRNAKIDEKLRRAGRGDGMPSLGGKGESVRGGRKKTDLGALARYDGTNESIWERGGEKRISRR